MKRIISLFVFLYSVSFAEYAISEIAQNSGIIQVTKDNIEATLAQSSLPTIVDVNATWCNPCRMMGPIFDEVSTEYEGQIQFAKIDFDSQSELVKKFRVTSLPTILFFKRGQKTPVMRHAGLMDKQEFEAQISKFLKK
jgi:thioredoxin 1